MSTWSCRPVPRTEKERRVEQFLLRLRQEQSSSAECQERNGVLQESGQLAKPVELQAPISGGVCKGEWLAE